MGREHLEKLGVSWGHERHQLVGRGVLTAPRSGGLRTARPTFRFMESVGSSYETNSAVHVEISTRFDGLQAHRSARVSRAEPTRLLIILRCVYVEIQSGIVHFSQSHSGCVIL